MGNLYHMDFFPVYQGLQRSFDNFHFVACYIFYIPSF